jgi:hypothetical protein
MPVTISKRPRASAGPPPTLSGSGSRISERPGALEDNFRREAAFTAEAEKRKTRPKKEREAPMRVRMLQTMKGSLDGINAELFQAGVVYDLIPSLASPWLERGICELDRMIDGAPFPGPAAGPAEARPAAPAEPSGPIQPEASANADKGRVPARSGKHQPAGPASASRKRS